MKKEEKQARVSEIDIAFNTVSLGEKVQSSAKINKKVLSLCLNPAIDKNYTVSDLEIGAINRVTESVDSAGGKAINVAKVLKKLGVDVCVSGILGEKNGKFILSELDNIEIKHNFFYVDAFTRSCIHIYDKKKEEFTEILESGFPITSSQNTEFLDFLKSIICVFDIVIMSGSCIKGLRLDIYKDLINICNQNNIKVFLDTSLEPLKFALQACPYLVKPNEEELLYLMDKDIKRDKGTVSFNELVEFSKKIIDRGISKIVVSLGDKGAFLASKESNYFAKPPFVKTINTVGCGDCMLAGFVYGYIENLSDTETLQLATKLAVLNTQHKIIDDINIKNLDDFEIEMTRF